MSDWNQFLQSDEFREYRKKQIELLGLILYSDTRRIMNGAGPEMVTALDAKIKFAKELILELPGSLTSDKDVQKNLKVQNAEDIANLSTFLVRKEFNEIPRG